LSEFHTSPTPGLSTSHAANDQLFAAAFDNAPHPMALLSASGQIVHANRSLCRILGFTRANLCAMGISDVTHPDDAETERAQRQRLGAAHIGRYELIQRCVRKDLQTVWVRLSVSAIRSRPLEAAYFIVALDPVPAHNCPEAAINEVWFARLGDATLSTVHEIGNTLTALMLNAEMLVQESNGVDVRDAAHSIFKAARRIAFALRRLRRVQEPQSVAYLGPDRLLDLSLLAPPAARTGSATTEAGAA